MADELYGMSPMAGYGALWPSTPQEEMMQQQHAATAALDKKQEMANLLLQQQESMQQAAPVGQTRVGRSNIARPSLSKGFGAVGQMLGAGLNRYQQGQEKSDLAAQQAAQIAAGKAQEAMGQQTVLGSQITQQGIQDYAAQLAEEQRLAEMAAQAEMPGVGFETE